MNRQRLTIAVVDDDLGLRNLLSETLQQAGYQVLTGSNGSEAFTLAAQCDLLVLDVRLPDMSGITVLRRILDTHPALPVILLTAWIDVRDAVTAVQTGARDYLEKPVDLDNLVSIVDITLHDPHNHDSAAAAPALPQGVIACSPALQRIFSLAARVAHSDATVLLLGESGVGKDVVASYIHRNSNRNGPLVHVNCGSLPAHLVESELFGHEKGAFTGADGLRRGRFEEAGAGSIFLDELGELPLELQPKLLQVLENRTFRRVGGNCTITAHARVLAATNRPLEKAVDEGAFRRDLFYRINVFSITIPPLRDRREDILPIAEQMLATRKMRLSAAARRLILHYDWPGNVRELRNAIERAAIMASGSLVLPSDLPPLFSSPRPVSSHDPVLSGNMQAIQRRAIEDALKQTGGNKTRAARVLNISRRTLFYRLREYGL